MHVEFVIRGRDDLDAVILSAISDGFSENAGKLMRDVWHDGVFAEYARVALENCVALDGVRLCQDM